ncbi:hypothetical protein GCM10011514_52870 [Emticicia aquatilis]|uniref:Ig-like domain-containing protein n=2 Tax=Emticicia aquatilis TaxID=1537369 RepID=A0A917DYH5_9BACT|nr:hypothetical protein GCM10011514_52870 [Emticicia aquatilis]
MSSFCQTVLYSESFETDGEGTRYTTNTFSFCSGSPGNNPDYFLRTNTNPATPPGCTIGHADALTNIQGSYFWASEDIRSSSPVPNAQPPGSIVTSSINISGYSSLAVSLYLATSSNNGTRWEIADSINVQVSINGGVFNAVGRFMGDVVTGGRLRIDSNLDGIIDANDVSTTCDQLNFTKYTFSIPYTGNTMQVKLDFDQVGGTEELGIDLIEVTGNFTGNVFWQDNFENATTPDIPAGSTRTPSINMGSALPSVAYFKRSTNTITDISLNALFGSTYAGMSGTYIWAGEDHDNIDGTAGEPPFSLETIEWTNINISGKSNISFKGLLAANNVSGSWDNSTNTGGSDPAGPTGINDYIMLEYAIDGGAYTRLALFIGDNIVGPIGTAKKLKEDTNNDGVGDGLELTNSLTEIVKSITGTGSTMKIRLSVYSNGNNEEWAVDNFRLENVVATSPEIAVKGNNINITDGDNTPSVTDHTDFGSVATSSGAIIRTFIIENTGTGALNLSGSPKVAISGNTADFTVSLQPSTPVAATNGTTTFQITFDPTTTGLRTATVSIANDDADENPFTFGIQGVGNCDAGTFPPASISGNTNLSCSVTSVQRTASGGGTYQWSNNLGTNSAISITSSGTYTVTITGTNGCTATATTSVTLDNTPPNASISGNVNLSCSVTSVQRTASGVGNYLWSNSLGTSATVNIISSGTYTVTVTGANGCTATATTSVTLDNTPPNASISGNVNLSCSVTSVQRTASGVGSYLWSNSLGTSATVNIISSGTYTVTVTGVNGCTATATTSVILDNIPPNANISGNVNLSCSVTSVQRTASGVGSYLWSNSLGTSSTVNITSSGTYTVTITGANGCTATATTSVTLDNTPPNASISGNANLSCSVTSVQRTASGVGSYLWSNSLGTSSTVNIISSGTYTVTVTGVNGCTATATTSVTLDNTPPNASISGDANLSCSVTSVQRTASGVGSYLWSNSLGTSSTVNITSSGTYTVTVTGANGCTATATTSVSLDNTPPNASISGNVNLSCSVTSVQRTASGVGSYLWSNSLGTSSTVNIISSGTYTVTVTGVNGCTATATTSVTLDNTPPNASISGDANLSCSVTSVQRTASGVGSYLWSNSLGTSSTVNITSSGTYTVTITGANGCTATATTSVSLDNTPPNASISGNVNLSCSVTSVQRTASGVGSYLWSNSLGTSATVNIISSGTYTVTVTGTNGCTVTATTSVTLDNTPPNASISGNVNLSCSVTSVQRTASGVGSYLWSNSLGTSATVNITSSGTYTVTVTGINGCTATATTSVTLDNTPPNASISGNVNLSCSVTSVQRTASGVGSYLWSNSLGTSATVNIISSGTYTVTVTGTNGCTATATTSVTLDNTPPNASISGNVNLSCSVTSVQRTASGVGSYLWSNSLGTSATVNIISSGTYTVTVTGTNGCTATATTSVILDNIPPNASISGDANLSCSVTSVQRTASGFGSYLWSNNLGTSSTVNIISSGTYTVTVTGTNGCTATATTSVTLDNTPPNASISGDANLSCSVTSVQRTASGVGSYLWSNNLGTSSTVNIISSGTYTVTVTGGNGCTATATTSVTFTNDLNISASNTGPYNVGQTIELNIIAGIGTTPSSYIWTGPNSFSSTNSTVIISNALPINAGIYTVMAIGGVCSATTTTNVIVSGVDPCTQILDLQFVKAGNPYQSLVSLSNGLTIQQLTEPTSILAVPLCSSIIIESIEMNIVGPQQNWTILQNVQPFALFDNLGQDVFGRNLLPGTYTVTITGYAQDNRGGGITYGPVSTTFTIVGSLSTISIPTLSNNSICAGSSVDVSFSTNGAFNLNNNFIIQLSDVNGSFSNSTNIGTTTSAGTITCQIPMVTTGGTNYRIRVISSNPILAGNQSLNTVSVIPATNTITNNVTGTITEQAVQRIAASNKVNAPANVAYQAGKVIELLAGFVANSGTVFKAEIRACN